MEIRVRPRGNLEWQFTVSTAESTKTDLMFVYLTLSQNQNKYCTTAGSGDTDIILAASHGRSCDACM